LKQTNLADGGNQVGIDRSQKSSGKARFGLGILLRRILEDWPISSRKLCLLA